MNPQPKPEPHAKVKARRRRTHAEARRLCRIAVWERDSGRCVVERCRQRLDLRDAHVHEVVYRSRGGSDIDPNNCVTLCPRCHQGVHEGLLECPQAALNGRSSGVGEEIADADVVGDAETLLGQRGRF